MNIESNGKIQSRSRALLVCLLLALATLMVYWPVGNFGFVDYDDPAYFFDNSHVLGGLTWANLQWAFTTNAAANWHPLTWLSLMLDAQFFGKGAAAPHITSVLLHAANAILVFLVLRRLTGAFWRSATVALFFALHPLHVESVAWIAERKDVLSAFFGLLTLLCYANYARTVRPQNNLPAGSSPFTLHPSLYYCLSLFFFAAGLLSKPMLVTFPFLLLLLDFWPLQRFASRSYDRLLVEKIPFLVLALTSSLVTFFVQQQGQAMSAITIPMRIENTFVSYARYLGKIFWPFNLTAPYPHPGYWPMALFILSTLLFLAFGITAVMLRKKFPYVFTGWFWFAGMLVPVIGLVQVGAQAMADRYMYLPIIGILVAAVWGVGEICARNESLRRALPWVAVLLLLACAVRARNQVGFWENDQTLFTHALKVTRNNYVASLNLAFWYSYQGNVPQAVAYYEQGLQMGTNGVLVATSLEEGPFREALYNYYLNPNDPAKLYNLGNLFARLGNWDEAIRDYRHALQLTPSQPDILDNLGFALVSEKKYDEAITNFQAALQLQPGSLAAHNNLATVYFLQKNYPAAAAQFQAALQLSPDDPRLNAGLAGIYFRMGQTNLAVQYYQQALHLAPGNPSIRAQLRALGAPPAP